MSQQGTPPDRNQTRNAYCMCGDFGPNNGRCDVCGFNFTSFRQPKPQSITLGPSGPVSNRPDGFLASIAYSINNSWRLHKVSWGVLSHDKELIIFPLLAIVSFLVVLAFGIVIQLSFLMDAPITVSGTLFGLIYFLVFFIFVYFEAAVIGAARIRFHGGDPNLSDGIRTSNANLKSLILWAVVSGTVFLILTSLRTLARSLQGGRGLYGLVLRIVGSLVIWLLDAIWKGTTYLVLPVIVYEQVYPITAIKRSTNLVRHTWGEIIAGEFGFGIIFFLLMLPLTLNSALLGLLAGSSFGFGAGLSTFFIMIVTTVGLLGLIESALRSIYLTALYEYATTGFIPSVFASDSDVITNSWVLETE